MDLVKEATEKILSGDNVRATISEAVGDQLYYALLGWTEDEDNWTIKKSGNAISIESFPKKVIDEISINANLDGRTVHITGHYEREDDSHELITHTTTVDFDKDSVFDGIEYVYNRLAQEYYAEKDM